MFALLALAAPAAAGHDVLQPGDPTSTCTLSWVLDGDGPTRDRPTAQGADGDAVYFTLAAHCLSLGDRVRSPGFGSFGTAVYDNDTLDLALVQVDEDVEPLVSPAVKGHEETPTGFATSTDLETGETVLHSGYGTAAQTTAETRENRVGVLVEDDDDFWGWKAVTPIAFGDSGGPAIYGPNGSALGIVNVLPSPTDVEPGTGAGVSMDQIFETVRGDGFQVHLRTVDCETCYGDDTVRRSEAVSSDEDARSASLGGDAHGGTATLAPQGDARGGLLAASGTGQSTGTVAASGTGDATGFAAAATGTGNATGAAALAPDGEASGIVAASATGPASGLVAASAAGDVDGAVAVTATGDASGLAPVTATGEASGLAPVSAAGSCSGSGSDAGSSECFAVQPGDAQGHNAAVGLAGDAECRADPVCLAAAGAGNADGPVAAAGTGDASALFLAASGTGDADGVVAVSGTGQARGIFLEVSGCKTAASYGVDAVCASPTARALP